ncbi:hypothetical protein Bhyg_16155 [Pseudolycoriella hygida]|uniref:Uncharacterized protein n=1 Tax=Pseudolycoriella hygida TaxID=35572 RepID=A0A9Q0RUD4_9DIPT|nr:hypothetical protein Bhyg_16155 [Pseudolycoriella hygida]
MIVIKMPNTMKIFNSLVLIFAIIEILQAQNHCDDTMCNDVCGEAGMNGTCKANNECDCHYDKKCSMLIDKTCDLICKEMKFNGECDENGLQLSLKFVIQKIARSRAKKTRELKNKE